MPASKAPTSEETSEVNSPQKTDRLGYILPRAVLPILSDGFSMQRGTRKLLPLKELPL